MLKFCCLKDAIVHPVHGTEFNDHNEKFNFITVSRMWIFVVQKYDLKKYKERTYFTILWC